MSSAMAPQGEKYQRLHDFLMGSFLPADFQMFLMLSMDPNRYEVSEPELLRGLRLS